MTKKYSHEKAVHEIRNFMGDLDDSGSGFCAAMNELAAALPNEPFSAEQLEVLLGSAAVDSETSATILTKAAHVEILPHVRRLLSAESDTGTQLSYAAMMAQLGDELGYSTVEEFFQKYMRKEPGFEDFDFERFVYVFEEILTSERGQEMISRFRKEADYHVEWSTLEQPDLE